RDCVLQPEFRVSGDSALIGRGPDATAAAQLIRRTAVRLTESRAEMAVAGETQLNAESSQVCVSRQQIQRACEPQLQLIPVQRQTFDLLKQLREINRGHANLAGNLRQSPAPAQV